MTAAVAACCAALAAAAIAQQRIARIWDVVPGIGIDALPAREFVNPACGNNGGPRGLPIGSFTNFQRCPAEADTGLREIWFEYDDTVEAIALARRRPNPPKATSVLDQPVVLSMLIGADGRVEGYRIFTDARAEPALRRRAHEVALHFKARFSLEGHCSDLPATPGEAPIEGAFLKERCRKETDGVRMTSEARFYFRPGQQRLDPHTGAPMANAFESSAQLEILRLRRDDGRTAPAYAPPAAATAFADQQSAFLAGAAADCPGCGLAGADLRYRDLTGANLANADLDGAILHRAILRGADLRGARLDRANLNRASLAFAKLGGATLMEAMLYQADAQNADLSGANLARAKMGRVHLAFANLQRTKLDDADLAEARISDADLTGAAMNRADMALAIFSRSRMQAIGAAGANFSEARLQDVDLAGARLSGADLSRVDLSGANLTGADFTGARLQAADLSNSRTDGAIFLQSIMPDGSVHE